MTKEEDELLSRVFTPKTQVVKEVAERLGLPMVELTLTGAQVIGEVCIILPTDRNADIMLSVSNSASDPSARALWPMWINGYGVTISTAQWKRFTERSVSV